jgi:hypothetical protein
MLFNVFLKKLRLSALLVLTRQTACRRKDVNFTKPFGQFTVNENYLKYGNYKSALI